MGALDGNLRDSVVAAGGRHGSRLRQSGAVRRGAPSWSECLLTRWRWRPGGPARVRDCGAPGPSRPETRIRPRLRRAAAEMRCAERCITPSGQPSATHLRTATWASFNVWPIWTLIVSIPNPFWPTGAVWWAKSAGKHRHLEGSTHEGRRPVYGLLKPFLRFLRPFPGRFTRERSVVRNHPCPFLGDLNLANRTKTLVRSLLPAQ